MRAKSRLKKLEIIACGLLFSDVLTWIRNGRYYDELTPEEQAQYCRYQYGEGVSEPKEAYYIDSSGEKYNYHFRLQYKRKPVTEFEIRNNVAFLADYMERRTAEQNSPSAIEKHKAEYEKLLEIGRKRKEAFYAGIPMSKYPLPWEKP